MAKSNGAEKIAGDGTLQWLPLNKLHLDNENPRFGTNRFAASDEAKIADEIVGQYGVLDVISSLAANSYFESEPLVGVVNRGRGKDVTILEGNRRLTACLILAGDPRARQYEELRKQYPENKFPADSLLPVQVYDWKNSEHRARLLPYLGVRHIVGALQWDSFAKAAWVAAALENSTMRLEEIKRMIGDHQNFTDRIVEGYYFVQQLKRTNSYDPANSLRRGRGSLQDFPFSWVYTALGYKSIRDFIGLPKQYAVNADPIESGHLDRASQLMLFMFGGEGRNAAIDDSREISTLARALSSSEAAKALLSGDSAQRALDAMSPPVERLTSLLSRADRTLADCVTVASGIREMGHEEYNEILDGIGRVDARMNSLSAIADRLKPSPRRASRKDE